MDGLSYWALETLGYEGYLLKSAPERILQFGEGNFLRAFVDYFVDVANEKTGFGAKAAVVQPIAAGGLGERFAAQDCLYTLYLRGFENGAEVSRKRVVSSIGRFIDPYRDPQALWAAAANPSLRYIVSNTTEAGIVYDAGCAYGDEPPGSFPAKLARFLHERWKLFGRGSGGGENGESCADGAGGAGGADAGGSSGGAGDGDVCGAGGESRACGGGAGAAGGSGERRASGDGDGRDGGCGEPGQSGAASAAGDIGAAGSAADRRGGCGRDGVAGAAAGAGAGGGLVILSCELIDDNGKELARCVERHAESWGLESGFLRWLREECLFCSTLVDRIVTGYPSAEADRLNAENGYEDRLLDTGESFGLWVIEGPEWLAEELPFGKAGLPVKVVGDHAPHKKQKVRILNGAHTSMAPIAWMCGQDIVRGCMLDEDILAFFRRAVWREIIPALTLPRQESEAFASAVEERFRNPFIDHALLSITLNHTSKWRARVLPSLKEYAAAAGELPPCLAFSLAAAIALFAGARFEGGRAYAPRGGREHELLDDARALGFYAANGSMGAGELARLALSNEDFWGEDLAAIPGAEAFVSEKLEDIRGRGMRAALRALLGEAGSK
ncbi:MAG: tagaturonate reductase [Clostridiales bacterium]|jgi:mannitol-1-phosphate/altronate dehydrogenase|nr:tagaturonate reductase [Clostridiales bacterium]